MKFFDFSGLRLDNAFRSASIFTCFDAFLIVAFTGGFVANYILKPKLSRLTASWNSLAVNIGTAIQIAYMAAPVRHLTLLKF